MAEKEFAPALGRLPSGIFVLTARRGAEDAALLASWVQQASFEPPTVSVAVHKDRPISEFLTEHAAFAVHILSESEKDLYRHFVKGVKPGEGIFSGLRTEEGELKTTILQDSLAVLECRVRGRVDAGDHHLILADVLAGKMLNEGKPRVHIRKNGLGY